MARKKWTAQTEVTDTLLRLREKRKWQLSYRRYVLESSPSEAYAPYFGLDMAHLRHWFEIQFTEGMHWDNYGKAWQFDHIVPTTYFDYANPEDLKLCWSFINIHAEKIEPENTQRNRVELLAVRLYFEALYKKTGYSLCSKMLEKITQIETSGTHTHPALETFIIENKPMLEQINSLDAAAFNRLNQGSTIEELLLEREILRKFGA